jgi:phosphohistidine swiveling domain-containing protein
VSEPSGPAFGLTPPDEQDPVVGTGDATTRVRTGDRVRVDGGRGTVEVATA